MIRGPAKPGSPGMTPSLRIPHYPCRPTNDNDLFLTSLVRYWSAMMVLVIPAGCADSTPSIHPYIYHSRNDQVAETGIHLSPENTTFGALLDQQIASGRFSFPQSNPPPLPLIPGNHGVFARVASELSENYLAWPREGVWGCRNSKSCPGDPGQRGLPGGSPKKVTP